MRLAEFIRKMETRIKHDCGLPITLSEETIGSYIDECSETMFHLYEEAKEEKYLVLDIDNFTTELFKLNRQIILPECVLGVIELEETGSRNSSVLIGGYGQQDDDFRKLDSVIGGSGVIKNSDDLVYRLIEKSYEDFIASNFRLTSVRYNYNALTRKLFIAGRNPTIDLIATVVTKIPLEALMDSIYFYKYVLAKLYSHTDLILSFVDVNLIGGNKINTSKLERLADKYQQEVDVEIEDSNSESFLDLF